MQTGMLWLDNSNKPLEEKIRTAAAYYEKKFGARPNLICVSRHQVKEGNRVGEIRVKPMAGIMPNYLWVGREDERG